MTISNLLEWHQIKYIQNSFGGKWKKNIFQNY